MAPMRYALYYLPRWRSRLWDFGSAWLGFDAILNRALPSPHPALTRTPRNYGFHATLKAPFTLLPGMSEAELLDATQRFASGEFHVPIGTLELCQIGHFLALTPAGPDEALAGLANRAVIALDAFRAPLSPADRARRIDPSLSERQAEYLDRWGYPYVFEEYRFHMTLTGALDRDDLLDARRKLDAVPPEIFENVMLDSVCLCVQPEPDARFRLLERFELVATKSAMNVQTACA